MGLKIVPVVVSTVCLTILGISILYTQPDSKLLYIIIAAVAGLGGYVIPKVISNVRDGKK